MDRADTISIIRGMVLGQAASNADGEGVRTEVLDEFDTEMIKVRVFVGERSCVMSFFGPDADKVLSDGQIRHRIESAIGVALADLR